MTPRPSRRRCAFVFFGIDRRLDLTGPVIDTMAVAPARARFDVSASGFLWTPARIDNPRSGEAADLTPPRFDCLPRGNYRCAPPRPPETVPLFSQLAAFGDYWDDGQLSLSNVVAQLESLRRATDMALARDPDIAVFLRPDLLYHDSFAVVLDRATDAAATGRPLALVPHWQPHGGLNDRFAICVGEAAIRAYGHRISVALDFCRTTGQPMHSEKLVRHALTRAIVPVGRIALRASRVRIDGRAWPEDFSLHGWKPALRGLAGRVRRLLPLSSKSKTRETS